MRVSKLRRLRWVYLILMIGNVIVVILGGFLVFLAYSSCGSHRTLPYLVVSLASLVRVIAIIRVAIAQEAAAVVILATPDENTIVDAVFRRERRVFEMFTVFSFNFSFILLLFGFQENGGRKRKTSF